VDTERKQLAGLFSSQSCEADPTDLSAIDHWLLEIQDRQARAQDALVAVDASDVTDRVGSLEATAENLRNQIDSLSGEISAREVVGDLAKKVENLTKAFPNEILAEQFDAVMPLLKEFYRRLRPHTDWDEIEYDFGGRIRATLNFYVADRRNPQFLFSSGQRRTTGLAFLLAVHLARHWAKLKSLVLDDPVQHIDDYRSLNLVEVLASIRRTGHQVVVAVEDASLAKLLARRLRVAHGQGGTFYELGTSPTGSTCMLENYELPPLVSEALLEARAS
jgi:DNA repair exonuclease SbcCD ATPase subunit